MDLTGKHIFITGAGKRLGRALAQALLPHRVRLTAHYRHSKKEAEELVRLAKQAGSEAHTVAADLASPKAIRSAVEAAECRFGPIGLLVGSASDFYPTATATCTEAEWDHLFDVNLKGQFFLAQAAAPAMLKQGGLILFLADVHGEKPIRGYLPYSLSKAALLMLTRNLALEWAPKVRVNAISPGAVLAPASYTEEKKAASVARTLLGRWGNPHDIVEAALFLIGNDYVTGMNLRVDGGRSLG